MYRTILLEALRAHPAAFAAAAEDESSLTQKDFAKSFDGGGSTLFGAFVAGELAVIATFQPQPLHK